MKKVIALRTNSREELVDITSEVRKAISDLDEKIDDGIAVVFTKHTTSSITINENADPDVKSDIIMGMKDIVKDLPFRHSEGNSDAHIKSSLMGSSVTVIIDKGELMLGTWQGIMFCEFDGPRQRNVVVKVLSDH